MEPTTESPVPTNGPTTSDIFQPLDFSDLEKITEESLDFSAITDGLGFHPKNKRKAAVDFVAAQLSINPANVIESNPSPLAANPQQTQNASPNAKAPLAIALEELTPSAANEAAHFSTRATLRDRFLAMALDLAIVTLPIIFAFFWNFADFVGFLHKHWSSALFLDFIVFCFYLLVSESLGGQSLGKMLLGIVVVENDKYRKPIGFHTCVKRLACFIFGLIPAGIGSLTAFWDSTNQAWHDKVSSSLVEKELY